MPLTALTSRGHERRVPPTTTNDQCTHECAGPRGGVGDVRSRVGEGVLSARRRRSAAGEWAGIGAEREA